MRRAWLLALAAIVAGDARADVAVLRDGTPLPGPVTSCVGKLCVVAGEQVPRGDIAWIGFGDRSSPPRSVPLPGGDGERLHLVDGTVVEATVVGVSLGLVAIEEGSYDRDAVAWIRFAGVEPPREDILVSRSGLLTRGELSSCAGASCVFDRRAIPRAEILWLGLAAPEGATPPALVDSTRDAVHLIDDISEVAAVLTIDETIVSTAHGTFAREEVAWIHLAPPEPDRSGLPGQLGAPQDDPLPGEPPEVPPRQEPTAPRNPAPTTSRGDAGPTVPYPPEDGLCTYWVGIVEGDMGHRSREFNSQTGSRARTVLRQQPLPYYGPGFRDYSLWHAGTVFDQTTREWGPHGSCSASGTAVIQDQQNGHLVLNPSETVHERPPCVTVPPGGGAYRFHVAYLDAGFPRSCGGEERFSQVDVRSPLDPTCGDGLYVRLADGGRRMVGSYDDRASGGWRYSASWDLQRVEAPCDAPPPPPEAPGGPGSGGQPPPEEDEDECPGAPTIQRGHLEVGLGEQALLAQTFTGLHQEHQALLQQAEQWKGDFAQASRDCKLWKLAEVLLKLYVMNTGPTETLTWVDGTTYTYEGGKQLVFLLDGIKKWAEGDPSWLLPNHEYQGWVSMEDAWEAYKVARESLGQSSPDAMLQGIQGCGAPTADSVYEGAVKYLRLLQQADGLSSKMDRTWNDMRRVDIDLFSVWAKYHQACVAHAECEGSPAAACDAPIEAPRLPQNPPHR